MKKKNNRWNIPFQYLMILILLTPMIVLSGQKLSVTEGMAEYQGKEQASVDLQVEPGSKAIKSALKDWMKSEFDINLKGYGFLTNRTTVNAEGVIIPTISNQRMDLYAKVKPVNKKTQVQFFGSFGPEVPINALDHPQAYAGLQSFSLDFMDHFLPKWYRSRIAEAQEIVSELKTERAKLVEDKQDHQDEILELEQEVLDIGGDIAKTENELTQAEKRLNKELNNLQTVGEQLERTRATTSYIVELDPSYFPSLKQAEDVEGRRSSQALQDYEKRVSQHVNSFVKEELQLHPDQITQIYSGTLLGFAIEVKTNEKEQFLKRVKQLKAIERIEEDQKVGIF